MSKPTRSVRVNGNALRGFRFQCGLTQQELASLAGYSARLIRKAESSGFLDISTVRNLSQALSQNGMLISEMQLTYDVKAIAKEWLEAFDHFGKDMVAHVKSNMSRDFTLYCPGEPNGAPFIGTWTGIEGLQKFLDLYFATFRRNPCEEIVFTAGDDLVHARFLETLTHSKGVFGPIRVTLCFHFQDSLIVRIDGDHDISAALKLNQVQPCHSARNRGMKEA